MKRSWWLLACVVVPVVSSLTIASEQETRSGSYPSSFYEAPEESLVRIDMMQRKAADLVDPVASPFATTTACIGGFAGPYPCDNVDLESLLSLAELGGNFANDVWGWIDPVTEVEYALVGLDSGTAFVDLSDPLNPVLIGNLPTHTAFSVWRDIKVYADHAFIVSEARGHGMQVFDLAQLRSVASPPVTFVATAHYDLVGRSHNVNIDEETGLAFIVGSRTCSGGLHIVNITSPLMPSFAGCFSSDGYTHDAQCVTYHGPDVAYQGREICFAYNEDTLTIADATDPSAVVQISRTTYADRGYTHQGWLTEDHAYALMDDEFDEIVQRYNTRTVIWDLNDLDSPTVSSAFHGTTRAISHNLYTLGNHAYQSNYTAGLRILDLGCDSKPDPVEVAFFDVYPQDDQIGFRGSWSNYPYYDSGIVVVTSMDRGLFVVRPALPCSDTTPPEVVEVVDELACLWPPNHRYVCFDRSRFEAIVSDDCGDASWEFSGCSSDQPDDATGLGDGKTVNDCVVTPDEICVRAERDGTVSDDRRYLVSVTAVDGCGNRSVSTGIGTIVVPHDSAPGTSCSLR